MAASDGCDAGPLHAELGDQPVDRVDDLRSAERDGQM
jgi:hypothetical protein